MGEVTKIAWTDHTFNAWIGCEKVSPECKNCYAAVSTAARVSKAKGLPLWGPDSTRRVTVDSNWRQPVKWNRQAEADGVRRRVFCSSLSDVFEYAGTEKLSVMTFARERLWKLIEATPWLDWLLLTKRPENVMQMVPDTWRHGFPPNVWIGTTAGTQKSLEERLPHLARIPCAVRFLSMEPLLEPVALGLMGTTPADWGVGYKPIHFFVQWVIIGGESGPHARECNQEWIEALIRECVDVGVPVFNKQLGAVSMDRTAYGGLCQNPMKHPKGGDPDEWEPHLRRREFPT